MENTSTALLDMLLIIVIITFFVFIVYSISKKVGKIKPNEKASVLEIPVKVVEKRVQIQQRNQNYSRNIFKIIFEDLDTLERHTFSIRESIYNQIIENDIGYLHHKGKRFHSFQRDELAQYFEETEDSSSQSNTQLKIED